MDWSKRRKAFRAILAGDRCVFTGSVYDPITARIAESLGFEAGMLSGSVGAMAVLGLPDLTLITLTEFAAQAYRINRAGNLPLLVDADHGYGNALNVMRTVEELETAGVAAMTIEDTVLPVAFGATELQVVSTEEAVGKMRAALAARQDPDFVIAGRTAALKAEGLEKTIARAKAYAATGVDALYLTGFKTREQFDAISGAISIPILAGSLPKELHDRDYLASRNVRTLQEGHHAFKAAVAAVYDTLKALRENTPAAMPPLASNALLERFTLEAETAEAGVKYLGG